MIDKITVRGVWGPAQPHHLKRLAKVSYERFLYSKTKRTTTTYINSPLTGAQIDVTYMVEEIADHDHSVIEITIPVASALVGHNYFHAGLEVLRLEVECLELLVRIVLFAIGMTTEESKRYLDSVKIQLLELTWHTLTASPAARAASQQRTWKHLSQRRRSSPRHDEQVSDVESRNSGSGFSLLATTKDGDFFRQYCKAEQLVVRKQSARKSSFVAGEMRPRLKSMSPMLACHVRNEVIAGADTLAKMGLAHPKLLQPEQVEALIDHLWAQLGFDSSAQPSNAVGLTKSAADTLRRIDAGENVEKTLPGYRISRDRKAIIAAGLSDRLHGNAEFRFSPQKHGRTLQYRNRWRPRGNELDLVVSERTAPRIKEELRRGLDFLMDGVLPEITASDQLEAFCTRWTAFAVAQHLTVATSSLLSDSAEAV